MKFRDQMVSNSAATTFRNQCITTEFVTLQQQFTLRPSSTLFVPKHRSSVSLKLTIGSQAIKGQSLDPGLRRVWPLQSPRALFTKTFDMSGGRLESMVLPRLQPPAYKNRLMSPGVSNGKSPTLVFLLRKSCHLISTPEVLSPAT